MVQLNLDETLARELARDDSVSMVLDSCYYGSIFYVICFLTCSFVPKFSPKIDHSMRKESSYPENRLKYLKRSKSEDEFMDPVRSISYHLHSIVSLLVVTYLYVGTMCQTI